SRNGTLVYPTGGTRGTRELVWVARDGKQTPVDTSFRDQISAVSLSPDAKRAVVRLGDVRTSDYWIKPLAGGAPMKLTTEGSVLSAHFTPDGTSIAYTASIESNRAIFMRKADGSGQPVLMMRAKGDLSAPEWSRD